MNFELENAIDIAPYVKKYFDKPNIGEVYIDNIAATSTSNSSSLTFSSGEPPREYAALISCSTDSGCVLVTPRPRDIFALILSDILEAHKIKQRLAGEISPSAVVSPLAKVHHGVSIGAQTVIHPFVVIHPNTNIGKNCIIREFTSIGADGFGVVTDLNGNNVRFPHLGGVEVGDYCEIGTHNTIDKGTLNDTLVGQYCKTDSHVHIAHNCNIGDNCILTAGAVLSGGVSMSSGVWLGPNSVVKQKIHLDANTLVGVGAVVTKDTGRDSTVAGNPAKNLFGRKN